MKTLARAVLPASAVSALARARRAVDVTAAAGIGAILRLLPLRVRALTREGLQSAGALDYPAGPIRLVVDSEVELGRLNSCRKEPETVGWIEQFVRPGDVVYDVGANVGAYSFVVDRATRGACTVYAFEPSFSTYGQLSRNVALNRCQGRVIPLLLALSDVNGLVQFNYSSMTAGAALHALGESVDTKGRAFVPALSQPVLSYRMDDLLQQFGLPQPNHIKLDVDGTELKILRGASRTLRDPALRTVLMEVEPGRPEAGAPEGLLLASGFEIHSRHPHGSSENSTANYVFTRRSAGP